MLDFFCGSEFYDLTCWGCAGFSLSCISSGINSPIADLCTSLSCDFSINVVTIGPPHIGSPWCMAASNALQPILRLQLSKRLKRGAMANGEGNRIHDEEVKLLISFNHSILYCYKGVISHKRMQQKMLIATGKVDYHPISVAVGKWPPKAVKGLSHVFLCVDPPRSYVDCILCSLQTGCFRQDCAMRWLLVTKHRNNCRNSMGIRFMACGWPDIIHWEAENQGQKMQGWLRNVSHHVVQRVTEWCPSHVHHAVRSTTLSCYNPKPSCTGDVKMPIKQGPKIP